jgi:anti-anti-sigma factor
MERKPARRLPHLFTLDPTPDGAAAAGEIDQHDADAFAARLLEIAKDTTDRRFVIDLSGVTFLDTTGLRALMSVVEQVREVDIVLIPSRRVFTILHLAGLADGAWPNVVLYPPPGGSFRRPAPGDDPEGPTD